MMDFEQALADLISMHIGEGTDALIAAMALQIIALREHETREEGDMTSPWGTPSADQRQ